MAERQVAVASTRRRGAPRGPRKFNKTQIDAIKRIRDAGKERNYITHGTFVATELNNTGTLTNMTVGITQGDGKGERTGDVINLTSIRGSFNLLNTGTSTVAGQNIGRYMLFQWHPDTAVETPTAADLFEHANLGLSILTTNKNYRSKFTVLMDKPINHRYYDKPFRFPISVNKLRKISFNPGAVTGKGHLYEFTYGNNNAAAAEANDYFHGVVIRYKDM